VTYYTKLTVAIAREGLWVLFLTMPFTMLAETVSINLLGEAPDKLVTLLMGIGLAVAVRVAAKNMRSLFGKSWPGAKMTTSTKIREGIWVLVLLIPCAVIAESILQEYWQGRPDLLVTVALGICLAVVVRWAFGGLKKLFLKSLQLRAENGDTRAQCRLAERYVNGKGVPKNLEEAAKWYRRAAENGNAGGALYLGLHLAAGAGVSKDRVEAAKWYKFAAEEGGIGSAAEMLGNMYRDDDPPDYEEAMNWYRRSVDLGRLESQELLSSLEEQRRQGQQ
jgi:hypothetical protein